MSEHAKPTALRREVDTLALEALTHLRAAEALLFEAARASGQGAAGRRLAALSTSVGGERLQVEALRAGSHPALGTPL